MVICRSTLILVAVVAFIRFTNSVSLASACEFVVQVNETLYVIDLSAYWLSLRWEIFAAKDLSDVLPPGWEKHGYDGCNHSLDCAVKKIEEEMVSRRNVCRSERERISRYVHQYSPTGTVSLSHASLRDHCAAINPGWEFLVWTEASVEELIVRHYPVYLSSFSCNDRHINLAKYAILSQFGGVFLPLNTACLRPFGAEFDEGNKIVVVEGTDSIIASPARHSALNPLAGLQPIFQQETILTISIPNASNCTETCASDFPLASIAWKLEFLITDYIRAEDKGPLSDIYRILQGVDSSLCEAKDVLPGTALNNDPRIPRDIDLDICVQDLAPPCVVYSFGITDNRLFDDLMLARGCEVRSFNPNKSPALRLRGPNYTFDPIGVGSVSGVHTGGGSILNGVRTSSTFLTLSDIMARNNHSHIDLIRMNIEAEWGVLEQWHREGLLDKLDQLLIRIHLFNNAIEDPRDSTLNATRFANILRNIQTSGLHLFSWEQNENDENYVLLDKLTRIYELGFMRLRSPQRLKEKVYSVYDPQVHSRDISFDFHIHPTDNPHYLTTVVSNDSEDFSKVSYEFAQQHGGIDEGIKNRLAQKIEGLLLDISGWKSFLMSFVDESISVEGKRFLFFPVVDSGLGRRLMQIAAASQIAEAIGRHLIVAWSPSEHCDSSFKDLFTWHYKSITVVDVTDPQLINEIIRLRPSILGDSEIPPTSDGGVSRFILAHTKSWPVVPILRVTSVTVDHDALKSFSDLQNVIVALDPDSGLQFALPGKVATEWRAKNRDILKHLRLSPELDAHFQDTVAATGLQINSKFSGIPIIGIHIRRDDPSFDSPNLEVQVPLEAHEVKNGEAKRFKWVTAGWSTISSHSYAEVALTALQKFPQSHVLIFSNEPEAAEIVSSTIKLQMESSMVISVSQVFHDNRQYIGRDADSLKVSAIEWFLLSKSSLVISSQRSEFARTACLAGSSIGIEISVDHLMLAHGTFDLKLEGFRKFGDDRDPISSCGGGISIDFTSTSLKAWGLASAYCLSRFKSSNLLIVPMEIIGESLKHTLMNRTTFKNSRWIATESLATLRDHPFETFDGALACLELKDLENKIDTLRELRSVITVGGNVILAILRNDTDFVPLFKAEKEPGSLVLQLKVVTSMPVQQQQQQQLNKNMNSASDFYTSVEVNVIQAMESVGFCGVQFTSSFQAFIGESSNFSNPYSYSLDVLAIFVAWSCTGRANN